MLAKLALIYVAWLVISAKASHLQKRALPHELANDEIENNFDPDFDSDQEDAFNPNPHNYEVSLDKYNRRLYEKDLEGMTRESRRKLQRKIDILLRKSHGDILEQGYKHMREKNDLYHQIRNLQEKVDRSEEKATGYARLRDAYLNGRDVTLKELHRANRDRLANMYKSNAIPMSDGELQTRNYFSKMMRNKKLDPYDEEKLIKQFRPAYLSGISPNYFSHYHMERKYQQQPPTHDMDKLHRGMYKADLKWRAVYQDDPDAANDLVQVYNESVNRHATLLDQKRARRDLVAIKEQEWRHAANNLGALQRPEYQSDPSSPTHFSDDDW